MQRKTKMTNNITDQIQKKKKTIWNTNTNESNTTEETPIWNTAERIQSKKHRNDFDGLKHEYFSAGRVEGGP